MFDKGMKQLSTLSNDIAYPHSNACDIQVDFEVKDQGYHMLVMFIHILELKSCMRHAKFQVQRA